MHMTHEHGNGYGRINHELGLQGFSTTLLPDVSCPHALGAPISLHPGKPWGYLHMTEVLPGI